MSDAQKLVRLEKRQALIEAGMIDPDEEDPALAIGSSDAYNEKETAATDGNIEKQAQNPMENHQGRSYKKAAALQATMSVDILALPGMKEAIQRKSGIATPATEYQQGRILSTGANHFVEEIEINEYPREARWKVTQKETTSRLQDEFQTAVTLKGQYCLPNAQPEEGERRLYLHLEATSERILYTCIQEIRRLLNEETLRVGARGIGGGHRYNVL
uniref:ATP-dependent RNA helicase PRP5/DDX46/KHDC4 KH domain-containing protein n=1 Tax=Eucampia antarctica TaxID=49252 RepID=A0A7S2SL76_9STRA